MASAEAAPVLDSLTALYAETFARTADAALRRRLLTRLETGSDPRAERYWQLLATVNGWPVPPSPAPAFTWFITAPRAEAGSGTTSR
ncbi:hypothetical protein ACFWFI_36370 [Streptomyces sp. NPDC060209]|uniref:hypothetical protein n=1 Tax=Streptomyces sp. NPDC060209 TaxID=3347073 RepID=UPI0036646B1A